MENEEFRKLWLDIPLLRVFVQTSRGIVDSLCLGKMSRFGPMTMLLVSLDDVIWVYSSTVYHHLANARPFPLHEQLYTESTKRWHAVQSVWEQILENYQDILEIWVSSVFFSYFIFQAIAIKYSIPLCTRYITFHSL
jgi:hypothetical protein